MGKPWISFALGAQMLMCAGQAGASTLYGTSVDAGTDILFTINPANGAFSNITVVNGGAWPYDTKIAFAPEASSAVPEPATWALLGVGFVGLACGGAARRKRGSAERSSSLPTVNCGI
jgi:hypothetical protein